MDGIVVEGQATLDQAAITGESMPVEAESGDKVFAATVAKLGYLKMRAEGIGRDTAFGRAVKMVEEAEANRGEVQRIADKFSGEGKTLLIMAIDGRLSGILAAMDTVRPEVATAIEEIRKLGIERIELLTGDNERTAAAIAGPLGIGFQANLLPEGKIRVVRDT